MMDIKLLQMFEVPNISHSLYIHNGFDFRGSGKSVKIICLENLALYDIFMHDNLIMRPHLPKVLIRV